MLKTLPLSYYLVPEKFDQLSKYSYGDIHAGHFSKFRLELDRKPSWSEDHHGHNHAREGRKVAIKIGNHGS